MIQRPLSSMLLAAAACAAIACHRQPTLMTPSSDQAAYATVYPDRLRDVRTRFAEDEAATRASFEALRALPSSAPAQNADELEQLVRRADAAGRSQPYVEETLQQEEIHALMGEGKGAIRRRVGGSVTASAKEMFKDQETPCLKDEQVNVLAGSAASATDRSVNRQLDQRLRAKNPAQRYLRAHSDDLGAERVNNLEKQVDALTRASFVSNVRLALYRSETESLLGQQKAVRTTLERDEAEGRAALSTEGLSKSNRIAIEEQVAKDESARIALDAEVAASQSAEADFEAKATALQKDYQALVDALLLELAAKQKAAAEAPAAPAAPSKSEPAAPAKAEPVKTEPAKTEPAKTEPAKTEPAKTAPPETPPTNG